jgi:threonine synthase
MRYFLECTQCGERYESDYGSQICAKCDGILEVKYSKKIPKVEKISSFWDLESVMPEGSYKHFWLGNTPSISSTSSKSLYLKLEFMNPTHSFKDRGSAIEVAKAREYGFRDVVCASTGNMAYSISYYAKLYGLKAKVFISDDANSDKIKDIKSVGDADVEKVNGDFTKAQAMAINYSKKHGSFLCGDYCYRKEGQKSIAYEICASNPEIKNIIVPVGNATLLSATYKALRELKDSGSIKHIPKLIGVQSDMCKPLVVAFSKGSQVRYCKPMTKADGIAVGYPTYGDQALSALKNTSGTAVAVTESSLAKEQYTFLRDYGLVAELASVSVIAAYKLLQPKGQSVAVITGSNV